MIGINGMGRIGRTFFRVLHQQGRINELTAVNDVMPKKHLIYLLQYDTVRGTLTSKIEPTNNGFTIDGHEVRVFEKEKPQEIPWGICGVDIVVESTGIFSTQDELTNHIQAGAKKCILTTTGGPKVPLYIAGVNELEYAGEDVFSIGSCTVNGTAPLIKMLDHFKPGSIYLNVIHAYSARQNILDSYYPEIRRSRASASNIIPLNINLDISLMRLFPDLKGGIKSITSRVPIPCGVLTDMTLTLKEPPGSATELMNHLREQISGDKESIASITNEPVVSSDVLHNTHSFIIDEEFSYIMGNHAKLMVWFDNEWGFSNRLAEWVSRLS